MSDLALDDGTACPYASVVREPLSPTAAADIAAKLKALSDPVRLRLFSLVASHAGGEACVCDISGDFDVTQPTISHHLKVLKDAGLLASERRGSWVYYSARTETMMTLTSVLSTVADEAATVAPA
ncbi:helix-turn-helix transcriptional regulator [Mycolicibacterium novocastrense]|uniref:ArsR family transcriptional regulator n=1 Tax=Mycolicibacterium novocastrense TaxID=59813 RepID=A0AAW5SGX2_MYCNV|nr:metalloregulator ArsR/SmtB family transcription factor [Mycolicibacterium novocastrense]MCV7022587.1 helix-turn-helix transcriptional regulator [Mycolicibacterium novocastrense]GAT08254.1 ArsR family transcriptional regulator [Mycolicibacterium novocastrense]